MRIRSVFSEAMRNIGSGTAHAVVLCLAVMLCGALFGGYAAYDIITMQQEAQARVDALADTDMIATDGGVDGAACDGLPRGTASTGMHAGAVDAGAEISLLSTPGKALQSFEVTPGMLELIASNDPHIASVDPSGVWVPEDVARDFGLSAGSRVQTSQGAMDVAQVYAWPNDGRDTRFSYTFLIPRQASGKKFDECWVRQWPRSQEASDLLYSTLVADGRSMQAAVIGVNKGFDAQYDPYAAYAARVTRWAPMLAALCGAAIGVYAVQRRRLEYAGALHSGQSKGAQLLGIGTEALVWSALGVVSSCALICAYCVRTAPSDAQTVVQAACRAPLATAAAAVVAAVAAGVTVRQSQLFRLFKHR